MAKTINDVLKGKEMRKFYRALGAVQRNSTFYLMSAKDAEELKTRAIEITKELIIMANEHGSINCRPDEVWNPQTGRCEPA